MIWARSMPRLCWPSARASTTGRRCNAHSRSSSQNNRLDQPRVVILHAAARAHRPIPSEGPGSDSQGRRSADARYWRLTLCLSSPRRRSSVVPARRFSQRGWNFDSDLYDLMCLGQRDTGTRGTDGSQTHRWREMDSNFRFRAFLSLRSSSVFSILRSAAVLALLCESRRRLVAFQSGPRRRSVRLPR